MLPTLTYPRTRDLDSGVKAAINRTAAIVEDYHGRYLNRILNGDRHSAALLIARESDYIEALARLEHYADQHGLLVHCCTGGEDCYHAN